MKKLIFALITLAILLGSTWFVSDFMNAKPIDYAFITGLIITIIIRFFTSSGGFTSNSVRLAVQSQTGMKVSEEPVQVSNRSFSFLVSLVYTLATLIVTVVYYWNEF